LLFETNLNKILMKRAFAGIFLLFLILVSACKPSQSDKPGNIISVSILPQKYFVERIAGDLYSVNVMVPRGISPETYEPSMQQMKEVAESSIYFLIGHIDFELSMMKRIKSMNPTVKFIDSSEGTDIISGHSHVHADGTIHHHGADPHIWLSPREVRFIAKNIYEALKDLDTENTDYYTANYQEFLTEIHDLDQTISFLLQEAKGKTIIVYHPAFAYFARDYGLNQESIEQEGKNPAPAQLKRLVDIANKENISAVFVQKEYEIDYSMTLAREINAEIIVLDDLAEDWNQNMIDIAQKIKSSFLQ
jgi:zinc transport system substrate-binding protein